MSQSSHLESGQILTGVWRTVVHRLGGGQIAFRGCEYRVETRQNAATYHFFALLAFIEEPIYHQRT